MDAAVRTIADLSVDELREWIADWCACDGLAAGDFGDDSIGREFDDAVFIDEDDRGWWDLFDGLLAAYVGKATP